MGCLVRLGCLLVGLALAAVLGMIALLAIWPDAVYLALGIIGICSLAAIPRPKRYGRR